MFTGADSVSSVCIQTITETFSDPDPTATRTVSFDPENGELIGFGAGQTEVNFPVAFPYHGDVSKWVSGTPDNDGGAWVRLALDLPRLLAQIPEYSSKYPGVASCLWASSGYGAPTALIPATGVTAPVTSTSTIAGNYVSSDPSTATQTDAPTEAASLSSPSTAKPVPTTHTVPNINSPLTLVPSGLSETAETLITTKATTQLSETSKTQAISTTDGVNLSSASASAGQSSTPQNDNNPVQPLSTPNVGSLIAGVFGMTRAQPSAPPSTTSGAVVSRTRAQSSVYGLVSSANAASYQVRPVSASSTSPLVVQSQNVASDNIILTEAASYVQIFTAIIGETTAIIYSVPTPSTGLENDSPLIEAHEDLSTSQAGPQKTQESTLFTTNIKGTPTTMSSVPDPSGTASEALPSISDLVLPVQGMASLLVTAILNGAFTTVLAVPIRSISSASSGDVNASIVNQMQQLPQAKLVTTIINKTLVTAWTVPAASTIPEQNLPTDGQPQPILIIATNSGRAMSGFSISPNQGPNGDIQTRPLSEPSLVTGTIVSSLNMSYDDQASSMFDAVDTIDSARESALSTDTSRQSATGATTPTESRESGLSGSTHIQTSSTIQSNPAKASSSTSGARSVEVSWSGVFASYLVALVLV